MEGEGEREGSEEPSGGKAVACTGTITAVLIDDGGGTSQRGDEDQWAELFLYMRAEEKRSRKKGARVGRGLVTTRNR